MSKIWTDKEINFLISNFPIKGGKYCSKELGRTEQSVFNKASRLGIKAPRLQPNKKTTEQYVDELKVKNIAYRPLESYIEANTPILHECVKGHTWNVRPKDILNNKGCPYCNVGSYKPNLSGTLYYIRINAVNETYYKIGITNRSVKDRFKADRKLDITILYEEHFQNGADAKNIESEILNFYPRVKVPYLLIGGGNTELFEYDVLGLDT